MGSGLTYDCLQVPDGYRLRFQYARYSREDLRTTCFYREFNIGRNGREKPYWVCFILGWHFSIGWLWERDPDYKSVNV